MKNRTILSVFIVLTLLGCAPLTLQQKEKRWGTHPPVIKAAFASNTVRPGRLWRVYLDVEDIDGDLDRLYVFIYQAGIGMYPPSVTKLPQKFSHGLKGYFVLPIENFWTWGIKLDMEIFFKDKAGHKSNPVYFSVKVVYKKSQPEEVPEELDRYLGTIGIDVRSPLFDDGGFWGGINWIWGN
ncbi:MAG: hypothetical protein J7M03_07060 [Candidatus Desulfofervidaceae bacterium]|nr:hypothetical protein [Candidatus Desulfofervidaceae bacterium]MDL1970199.1 hypothetical protein [Candidatus Desulfofervidaceae bacterium]